LGERLGYGGIKVSSSFTVTVTVCGAWCLWIVNYRLSIVNCHADSKLKIDTF